MLGDTQERWLGDGLTAGFDWNLLGLGGLVMPFDRSAQKVPSNGYDNWTGYPDARERLVRMIGERGKNVVITGGDSHMFFIGNVPSRRRSEEHTSELQSLMRISYAVFCL